MAYYSFQEILSLWESWGLSDVVLPFLLVLAIVFAALEKVKIFGEDKKRVHIIIALVVAFTVVIPHITDMYPPGSDVVDIINSALPQIAVILIAIVMIMVLVGLFGKEGMTWLVALIAIIVVGYIFASAAGWLPFHELLYWLEDPTIQSIIIIVLIFGLAMWLITGGERPKTSGENILEKFGKLFKRP